MQDDDSGCNLTWHHPSFFSYLTHFPCSPGPGSLYKVTGESGPDGPKYEATHAIWQKGRPISSVAVPFKPGLADMPSKKEVMVIDRRQCVVMRCGVIYQTLVA